MATTAALSSLKWSSQKWPQWCCLVWYNSSSERRPNRSHQAVCRPNGNTWCATFSSLFMKGNCSSATALTHTATSSSDHSMMKGYICRPGTWAVMRAILQCPSFSTSQVMSRINRKNVGLLRDISNTQTHTGFRACNLLYILKTKDCLLGSDCQLTSKLKLD